MKKVINKKLYNTETAARLGCWDNGHYTNDFGYCSEDLYRTKSGNFFLHGEGGPMSKYSQSSGNSMGWGERIVPLTYDEAQEWAEKHLDGDDYINIFGEPEESDDKSALNVRISNVAYTKLKQTAAKQGITLAQAVENLIG
jgi:hypothetical protein